MKKILSVFLDSHFVSGSLAALLSAEERIVQLNVPGCSA